MSLRVRARTRNARSSPASSPSHVDLAQGEPVAVGGDQAEGAAVDLDPDRGEDRRGLVAGGGDGDLRHGGAEDLAGDGADALRRRRQLGVLLDRHERQGEAAAAGLDAQLGPVEEQRDRLGRQRPGDVGQQPALDEDPALLEHLRRGGHPGGHLVVERRQLQAVRHRDEQHPGEDGDRRTGREHARGPRDRLREHVTVDRQSHGSSCVRVGGLACAAGAQVVATAGIGPRLVGPPRPGASGPSICEDPSGAGPGPRPSSTVRVRRADVSEMER